MRLKLVEGEDSQFNLAEIASSRLFFFSKSVGTAIKRRCQVAQSSSSDSSEKSNTKLFQFPHHLLDSNSVPGIAHNRARAFIKLYYNFFMLLEPSCCKKRQKSPGQETGNRGT